MAECNYRHIALIPAYMPVNEIITIVSELSARQFSVVVVNDGSPKEYDPLFDQTASFAQVIRLPENMGKGEALKEGLRFIAKTYPSPYIVVTLDADGQHKLEDVYRVVEMAEKYPEDLILGSRELKKDAPIKSRIGNSITNVLYKLTTKSSLNDTQTGLRAFSDRSIDKVLHSGGSKYEFEMFMLLNFSRTDNIRELPIQTVYANGENATTHFRAVKDSLRIYRVFFRYMRCGNQKQFNQC